MPAPEPFTIVSYAVIVLVPIFILIWYYQMYSTLGRGGVTGGGLSRGT